VVSTVRSCPRRQFRRRLLPSSAPSPTPRCCVRTTSIGRTTKGPGRPLAGNGPSYATGRVARAERPCSSLPCRLRRATPPAAPIGSPSPSCSPSRSALLTGGDRFQGPSRCSLSFFERSPASPTWQQRGWLVRSAVRRRRRRT